MSGAAPRAGRIVVLVALLQFVYLVDFLLPLPLGPDLAGALSFPADRLGWLSAVYTVAAVVAGLLAGRWLDRFDRRSALVVLLAFFAAATAATALADGLPGLMVARAVTGFIGGPLVAVGMAAVIDSCAPEARGAAIGKVMIGFSAAAVAGIPASLELARVGGWAAPFLVTGGLALLLAAAVARGMPAMPAHGAGRAISFRQLLARPAVRRACALQAVCAFSAFLVIPSFSAFLVLNLGVPRAQLGAFYLVGGLGALVALQGLGRLADRRGPVTAVAVASVALGMGLLPLLGAPVGAAIPGVLLAFVAFMAGNAGRNVALGAATSGVPAPQERAAFMALQSISQDLAIALAALVATGLLSEAADGRLLHMPAVAGLSLALVVALPVGVAVVFGRRVSPATAGS